MSVSGVNEYTLVGTKSILEIFSFCVNCETDFALYR